LEAAKKRSDMVVQVGLEYRYMPPVAKLIEQVKGRDFGNVKMVAIREHRFPFLVKVGLNKMGLCVVFTLHIFI
jgi:predicted dehydrogenase